jgi:hypothetical protein
LERHRYRGTHSCSNPANSLVPRYTFSVGLKVGNRTLLSGDSASEYDPTSKNIVVKGGMAEQLLRAPLARG